jgi:hypothetical protein
MVKCDTVGFRFRKKNGSNQTPQKDSKSLTQIKKVVNWSVGLTDSAPTFCTCELGLDPVGNSI